MYSKKHLWLIVLVSAVVIAAALYSQYVLKMDPCPLCIFQRVAVIFVGLFALLMAVLPQRKSGMGLFSAVLISIPALIGLGIAIRQRYIQGLPPSEVPACGPGLDFMMDTLPLQGVIQTVLSGSGECAAVEYVMGVPLPIWSALFFVFAILVAWGGWFKFRRGHRY